VCNNKISTTYSDVHFLFEMANCHVAHQKILFNVFYQRRAGASQKQRYSAFEVHDAVFGLKGLVPVPL
jgi:hypothetical protein